MSKLGRAASSLLPRGAIAVVLLVVVSAAVVVNPWSAAGQSEPEIAPGDGAGVNVLEPGYTPPGGQPGKGENAERVIRGWYPTSSSGGPKGSPKG
jgi:hypothetical protein